MTIEFAKLSPSEVAKMVKGKLNLIIGTLSTDGNIFYRDTKISDDQLKGS